MAANPIGSLYVALGLDSAEFETGIAKAKSSIGSFGKINVGSGIKSGLSDIKAGFQQTAAQAGVLGSALASMGAVGVAAGVAMVGFGAAMAKARDAMLFADELADTAAKLAVTTDALQEYRYAMIALGGDASDADAALEGFSKAFGAAHAQLTARAAKPFKALGLDPQDFENTEDALQAVIDKISRLSSTAEQAAIADKLGLSKMLVAIRAGADEMERLRIKAHQIGIVMDASLIKRAGEANDEFETLSRVIDFQLKSAFVDLAPVLTSLMGMFSKMAGLAADIADSFRAIENKSVNRLKELRQDFADRQKVPGLGALYAESDRKKIAEIDAILAKRAAENKPAPTLGDEALIPPAGPDRSAAIASASEAAVEAAVQAELSARMGLTRNIERLAELRLRQIDVENASANRRLEEDAAQGQITRAAANKAIALNNEAAAAQRALVQRDLELDLADDEMRVRQQIAGFYNEIAQISSGMASTAAQRNEIERQALAHRQRIEKRQLELDLARQIAEGTITESQQRAAQASQEDLHRWQRLEQTRTAAIRAAEEAAAATEAAYRLQMDGLSAQANLTRSTYERSVIEARMLKLRQRQERHELNEIVRLGVEGGYRQQQVDAAKARLAVLEEIHANERALAEEGTFLIEAIEEAADAVHSFKRAFGRGDFSGALASLLQTIQTVRAAFATQGMGGGIMTLGSAAASAIGGKTGRAIGGGLGLAAMGAGLGTMLTANALPAVGALTGVLGVGGAGMIGGLMSTVGAALGPIGLAAGALYAAAKLLNVGGKPTNAGAGYDLTTGRLSGDRRTAETESAVKAAADAIKGAEDAFKAAGITLGDTIRGLVIGTRDQTQIYTASGRTIMSAVGDAAAATDAAVRAMLDGATFATEAQEKLVRSMLAAGKGFDEIAQSLQAYEQAQAFGRSVVDEILRLTDPKGYDLLQLERAQDARRKEVEQAIADGYLAAEQAAELFENLARLNKLELDDVLRRYSGDPTQPGTDADRAEQVAKRKRELEIATIEALGDSVGALAARRQDELAALHALDPALATMQERFWAISDASAAVAAAEQELKQARDRERERQRQEASETVSRLRNLTGSLRDFRKELFLGSSSMLSPQQRYDASKAAFERIAALAEAGDRDAMEQLQAVSEDYLEAAREVAPNAAAYARDLAAVRATVATAEAVAGRQLTAAEAQLATLEDISSGVDAVAVALEKLAVAMANLNLAKGGSPTATPGFDVQRYLASNPDLQANWDAGGIMRQLGASLEEAALAHFERTGKDEIAGKLRHYARGGFHPGGLRLVGEEGAEIEATGPARYYSAQQTAAMLSGEPAGLSGEVRAMRAELNAGLQAIAVNTGAAARSAAKVEKFGMPVRGPAIGDPVPIEGAAA